MSDSLFDLTKLITHVQSFAQPAASLGFSTPGEIERFLFKSYGRAIREIPPANRPRGALFFLARPGTPSALASPKDLKPVVLQIQRDIAQRFYEVPTDLAGGIKEAAQLTSAEQRQMASGAWTPGQAQLLSRCSGRCVVWGNGVGACVFLAGDCFLESPDVVEELPTGLPSTFQSLSWANGEIVYHFAENELNDTSETGIWRLPEQFLLRSKPEKIMSVGLGRFLRLRMAGYRHHEDEAHVENEGRADISLVLYNGLVEIIEVKWVGKALVGTKQLENDASIKAVLQNGTKGWVTEFDDAAFGAGARQLAKYFKTGKYHRAYLAVFDCCKPKAGRKHECCPIDDADVAPFDCGSFRAYRACADPRKASKSSKTSRL
jgi:hypothetical protein